MPGDAAVGQHGDVAARHGQPVDVPDRRGRAEHQQRARRQRGDRVARQPRRGQRRRRRPAPRRPRRPPGRRRRCQALGPLPVHRSSGPAPATAARRAALVAAGVGPARGRRDRLHPHRGIGEQRGDRPGQRRAAHDDHAVGPVRGQPLARRPAAAPRPGGARRAPQPAASARRSAAAAGRDPGGGGPVRPPRPPACAAAPSAGPVATGAGRPPPPSTARRPRDRPTGRSSVAVVVLGQQRLAQRQVQVHRTGIARERAAWPSISARATSDRQYRFCAASRPASGTPTSAAQRTAPP